LTLATLLTTFIGVFVPEHKRSRWLVFVLGLVVLSVLAHLVLERYRWQMVPAYGLTALTFLAIAPPTRWWLTCETSTPNRVDMGEFEWQGKVFS
jgi:hypothetical protein